MFYYVAVCEEEYGKSPPFTIFVTTDKSDDALVWNQRTQAWQYDPDRVVRFTADYRNWDRYETVDRKTAEEFSRQLAIDRRFPLSELPTEDWIEWFFSWKGDPPDHEDPTWDTDMYVREAKERQRQQAEREQPKSPLQRTEYHTWAKTADHAVMAEILRTWLGIGDLTMTVRQDGYAVEYRDDTIELYATQGANPSEAPSFFLLEGHIDQAPEVALGRLEALARLFRERGITFDIDYVEVDADGNLLGEEKTLD